MIDTIKIAQHIKHMPHTPDDFRQMGWRERYDQAGNFSWWFKEEKKSQCPYISIYKSPIGENFLWASGSLPAFVHGYNAILLTEDEISEALELLSNYIAEKSNIYFSAQRAQVWGVDFAKDFFVGEELIRPSIQKLSKIQLPRFKAGGYSDTTCYFHSSGSSKVRNKPRTICLYGKHEDAIEKKFSLTDIELTRGVLRAEYRLRDKRAVRRLCKKLELPDNSAETLLTKKISDYVLSSIEGYVLDLNQDQDIRTKIQFLLNKFGARRARALIAFLTLRDAFGEDFYKSEALGYSKSNYLDCLRDCRSAGIWSLH